MNVLGEGRNKVRQVEKTGGEKPPQEVWEAAGGGQECWLLPSVDICWLSVAEAKKDANISET